MSRSLQLSSSAFSAGVLSAAATPARADATPARSAMAMLSSPEFLSPTRAVGRRRSIEEQEAEEEQLEAALVSAAHQQAAEGALAVEDVASALSAPAEQQQAQQDASLAATLKQLETEPADAASCAAKFELYEGYAKLTEDARAATLELWVTAQQDFDAANAATTKQQIEREIAAIDRVANLGIDFDERRWFVHGMTKAACRNQRTLNTVLGGIQTKLELLASQSECPVCFDTFGNERPSTTLGCAHKVCTECWAHWSSMARGANPACPLCRHEEFLGAVLAADGGETADVH